MKMIMIMAVLALLAGCVHPSASFVIKNLDGWQRVTDDYHPTLQIELDVEGYPSAPKEVIDSFRARSVLRKRFQEEMQKRPDELSEDLSEAKRSAILAEHGIGKTVELQRVRWQIHPDAPLKRVALLTGLLTETERSEFWTTHGVFIVGAPNYGGRRLPSFSHDGKPTWSAEYRVTQKGVFRDKKLWRSTRSLNDAAQNILADLEPHAHFNFVNIYFELAPSASWSEVEAIMSAILPRIGGMRGMWIGNENDGAVTVHFHDITKQ